MNSKKPRTKSKMQNQIPGFNQGMQGGLSIYLKNLAAILVVKFTFYLVMSIFYVWLLVSLGFKAAFDWNLSFLITISLLLFSMMFERPAQIQVIEKK